MNLDVLFDDAPNRWGLRGDPHLWDELKTLIKQQDGITNSQQLLAFLKTAIENSIGQPLVDGQYPYVERFNSGGMSGGHIDCGFWLNTALPLLMLRFNKLQAGK